MLHEKFDVYEILYDIGLIKTALAIEMSCKVTYFHKNLHLLYSFEDYTNIIELPTEIDTQEMDGSSATVQGFGRFDDGIFEMSSEQKFITRRILSHEEESHKISKY